MKTLTENIKAILSVLVIILSFAYLFAITFTGVKADPQVIIFMVGAVGTVLNFWLGSSSSSQKKDDTIANAISNPVVNNAGSVTVQ